MRVLHLRNLDFERLLRLVVLGINMQHQVEKNSNQEKCCYITKFEFCPLISPCDQIGKASATSYTLLKIQNLGSNLKSCCLLPCLCYLMVVESINT